MTDSANHSAVICHMTVIVLTT